MANAMLTPLARGEADLRFKAREDMIWFANYLLQPIIDLSDASTFAAVVSTALDKHGLDMERMATHFGVARTTVLRWKNGVNAPQPFARGTVRDWIVSELRSRISEDGIKLGLV